MELPRSKNLDIQFEALGDMPLEELERLYIQYQLLKCKGSMTKAAKVLGLGRATMYRKLSRYNLVRGK